jgi:type IV secretion system protein VirB7
MKTFVILFALAALGACSHGEELATCKGPAFALNTGHWVPGPADLQMPKPGKPE